MVLIVILIVILVGSWSQHGSAAPAVTVSETDAAFTLSNGLLAAQIEKRTGTLISLRYEGLELLAQERSGANGGYWSSVGRGRTGPHWSALVARDPDQRMDIGRGDDTGCI